jgi:recombination associated protein RdgC
MWFKNIIFYRFTKPFTLSSDELEIALENTAFSPCGPQEASRLGWSAPLGRQGTQKVHVTGDSWMICLKKQERVLPATVIKEVVDERVTDIEDQQMRKVRKKEKDEIKEQVIQELLPKAFTRTKTQYAYLSPKQGFLIVNVGSPKAADELTSFLRKTIGSLPIRIPQVNHAPVDKMTHWLQKASLIPTGFELGDECELRDQGEEAGIVRCKSMDLRCEEVQQHLESGKQVVKLGTIWNENISFILNDDLSIKRLKFGDLLQEKADDSSDEDAASKFDASFAIMSLELAKLLPEILNAFGGEDTSAVIES